jgi:hypothetical protein
VQKEDILMALKNGLTSLPKIKIFGNKNYEFNDKAFWRIKSSLHVKSKAGGYPEMLVHIYQSIKYIAANNLEGDVIELGTYRGGTTVFIAKTLQHFKGNRNFYSFDTFSGFPTRSSILDIFEEEEYYQNDYDTVEGYCSLHNIQLIKGDILNTISIINGKKIAFSFFDTDNYTPTRFALEKIFDATIPNGILAFDHYYSPNWSKTVGERIAIKEVLESKRVFNLFGTGIFIKL